MIKVRRLVSVIALFCLVFSISFADTYTVTPATGVNLRSAKKEGKVIKVVRHGVDVNVIGSDNFWYEVVLGDGSTGFIYKQYLDYVSGDGFVSNPVRRKITRETDAKFIGTLKEDSKIYKTANGRVLGKLKEGDYVFILQRGKYWNKIVWNNTEVAYVQSAVCDITDVNIPGEGTVYMLEDEYSSYGQIPIRKAPNSKARRIKYIKNDSFVRVVEEVDDKWVMVSYDGYGHLGYVAKLYLKHVNKYN